jgi:hypothetical protein
MPSVSDFPARGRITAVKDGLVTFAPVGTTYELHLAGGAGFASPVGGLVNAIIRVKGRRLWTVPSGGNFISPIFGPPKTIQGRVRYADNDQIVVHAGTPIVVSLPAAGEAFDLNNGRIGVGALVNVVAFAGAQIEVLAEAAVR